MRKDIGVKYKDLTPQKLLEKIYERNEIKYGDKLGPTTDYFRSQGMSWENIIEKACREGGKDINFNK
ncbi:hemagglutinin-related protein [endosymbiont of Acanthamoeba sp. UWC8]|uniref:hypothetical protein n=1 Tax=endosymbiont of Acanthamoeba sp. UWC8 TaxID=86106 RepID=UPI0004D11BDF|nr:hypothetical protein [endosymbiont of Acanthamoeba sp. UWC8]AIF80954.1 hemagglutinin-related protein [endosymbiont of Acanthamoeba sp. UWC8]